MRGIYIRFFSVLEWVCYCVPDLICCHTVIKIWLSGPTEGGQVWSSIQTVTNTSVTSGQSWLCLAKSWEPPKMEVHLHHLCDAPPYCVKPWWKAFHNVPTELCYLALLRRVCLCYLATTLQVIVGYDCIASASARQCKPCSFYTSLELMCFSPFFSHLPIYITFLY